MWGALAGLVGGWLLGGKGGGETNVIHHGDPNGGARMEEYNRLRDQLEKAEEERKRAMEKYEDEMKKINENMAENDRKHNEALEKLHRENAAKLEEAERKRKEALQEIQRKMKESQHQYKRQMAKMKLGELVKRRNQAVENRKSYREPFMRQAAIVKDFQEKVKALKQQIRDEEKRLDKFQDELADSGMKRIVLYGPTGHGKSTLGNRIAGDRSPGANRGPFGVCGGVNSETSKIKKVTVKRLYRINISVTDCPGTADSFGRDRDHANNLVEFLRGIGYINCIALVRSYRNPRFDNSYQDMLRALEDMLGKKMWEHVVIVLTNAEAGDPGLGKYIKELRSIFYERMNISPNDAKLPVLPMDSMDKYEPKLDHLINRVVAKCSKFECKDLVSPLETLKAEFNLELSKLQGEERKFHEMKEYLKSLNQSIELLEENIRKQQGFVKAAENPINLNPSEKDYGEFQEQKKAEEEWLCGCGFVNECCDEYCKICSMMRPDNIKPYKAQYRSPKPAKTSSYEQSSYSSYGGRSTASEMWSCEACTLENKASATACELCDAPRPSDSLKSTSNHGNAGDRYSTPQYSNPRYPYQSQAGQSTTEWTCYLCNEKNSGSLSFCGLCTVARKT